MRQKKILVTGGAGYIGSSLIPLLLEQGYKVTCVDNYLFDNQYSLLSCMKERNFTSICDDVTSFDARIYREFDVIIPLAAIVGAPACDRNKTMAAKVNHASVAAMMKYVRPDARILFPNTNSGYSSTLEDACTEESPLDPVSLYGTTKVEAEKEVLQHKNAVVFRLATVYGCSPRQRLDLMVNDFVWRALKNGGIEVFDGHYRRNFVSVHDVCRAFLWMIDRPYTGIFNLGLDEANTTKLGLAHKVCAILGGSVTEGVGEDPDKRNYLVSNQKILKTGFHFKHSLESGIEEVAKFVRTLRSGDKGKFSNV